MEFLTLDLKGIILAFVIAFALLYLGLSPAGGLSIGVYFVVVMLYFLALSAIVTSIGETYKRNIRQYQRARGVKNVLANGLGPLIFAIVFYFTVHQGGFGIPAIVGFVSSVAAVTADKFNSEIGVLNGKPVSILTFKKLNKGVSGGVTILGVAAGIVGAFLISLIAVFAYIYIFPQLYGCGFAICYQKVDWVVIPISITLAGLLGSLVDSVLGVYEEKGIGSKYTTNFACSIVGGCFGVLMYLFLLLLP